jgi:catechol 2,3-dioxygenase-like lactoylglutathione lyase family enzyme
MHMVQVTELGYMGIGVKDLAAWKDFSTSILGLELADEGEPDRCYLRMDYHHHRIVMHNDGSDDLCYLGLRVAGADEFAQMQRQLAEAGIKGCTQLPTSRSTSAATCTDIRCNRTRSG